MNHFKHVNRSPPEENTSKTTRFVQIPTPSVIARVVLCAFMVLGASNGGAALFKPKMSRDPALDASCVLNPGDIIFTDSEAAVLRFDPVTRQTAVLATGGLLVRPFGMLSAPTTPST